MGRQSIGVGLLPYGCVGLAVLGFQLGAALVMPLFARVGAEGASALRMTLAALMLCAVMRPWRMPLPRAAFGWTLGYGLGLAGLNLFFYLAIRTLPLGVTVAVEFLGPLGLAVLGSRRPIDLLWAAMAGLGMLCLVPAAQADGARDLAGFGFALCSAVSWVAYILCGQRAGQLGHRVVAIGVTVAAVAVLPLGIAHAGRDLLRPDVLGLGLLVALVSGCLPYGLEMVALKRLPTRVFGILMSLEPAAGALFGYLLLGQRLTGLQGVAIAAVMAASAGSSLSAREAPVATPATGPSA
ncbi:EamA family transporter [Lichenihabitans sp. Uapishka_5]|uniref:EamA family transporter n=1 Tax=Lichenihabitans sp. Uapishka_5 TaxID=3037302 RepID=UPI0029E80591|nr:EamA family transporter [Lichenihabitans sp. Uapishka_5]MDX7954018.1 EamA family transporter [Lichenihabitans sp. Uapishka_5]